MRAASRLRRARHLRLLLFLLLLTLFVYTSAVSSSNFGGNAGRPALNPYEVLGVREGADQDEIRRRYRKLCLKYHPDKNADGSDSERKRCEEAFKRVQGANDLIGDEDSRRRYDEMAKFGRFGAEAGTGHGYGPSSGDFFRARPSYFYEYGYNRRPQYRGNVRRAFYFNGVDISNILPGFGRGSPFPFDSPAATPYNQSAPKSFFVQKVIIPLEELYAGVDAKVLKLSDTMLQRYKAAFCGGAAGQIALQALVSSVALLLRTSLPVSVLVFCLTFHLQLPHPTKLHYPMRVRRGWKTGTKVTFSSPEPGIDVVFIIKEGSHDRFVRSGDDLCTISTITKRQARMGCSLHIAPLSSSESPILVKLKPGEIDRDGQVKRVIGKGWPRRKKGGSGDLLVEFRLVSDFDEDEKNSVAASGSKRRRGKRKNGNR